MGFKGQQLNTLIKANLEEAFFCKDNVHCLQPIYIMLQVVTITYLMITDNTLILQLEITAYTAYTGYKGKIEVGIFQRAIYIL